MAKKCRSCGAWVDDHDKFCEHCGNNLADIDDPVVVDVQPEIVEAEIIQPPRRYESPAADAREVRERLIGEGAEYYLPRFEKMENLNSFTSWNWAAFLFNEMWMVYRRMYVLALAYWGVAWLVDLTDLGLLQMLLWIACGVVGNFLYMKDINNRTDKAMDLQPEERELFIQKNSGTSWAAVVIFAAVTFVLANIF